MSVDSKRLCLPIISQLNGVNKQAILQSINLHSSNRRHLHNSMHVSSQGTMPSLDASLTERQRSQHLNHSRAIGSSTAPSCRDLIAQSLTKKKMPISSLSVTKYKNLLSVPDNDPKHPDISMHIPIDNEETQFFIQSSALNVPAQPGMIPLRNLTKATIQDTSKDAHVTVFIPFRNSKEINKHEFLKLHSDNPTFQPLDFTSLLPNSTNTKFLEQKNNDSSNSAFADHTNIGNASSVNTSSSNLNDHSVNLPKKRKHHHATTSSRLPSTVELSLLHNKDILQQLNSNLQWESQLTYENVSDQLQQQEQRIKSMPIIRKYPIFKKHVPTATPTPHNNPPMSPTRRGSPTHRKSQLKIPSANVVSSGINLKRLDTMIKGVLTTRLLEQPEQTEDEEKKVRFIPVTNPGNYLVYWYTFEQNNWKPDIRELQSMVIESKRAYIFGGVGKELYNQLFELDLEIIKWNELKGDAVLGNFPSARFGHSCDLYKRNLVFFGGENRPNSLKFKDCLLDVFTFSLENKQWRQLTCTGGPPQPRKSHASVVIGRNLLIHGGVNNKDTSLKDMWLLDLGTLTWSEAEVAGEVELSFHKCVGVYHSQRCGKVNLYKFIELKVTKWGAQIEQEGVYFFGGKNTKGEASDELRVLKTDCKPMQWLKPETKGIPPKGRYGHSMTFAIEHNVIAIFGGKNDLENDVYLNDLHLLSLDTFSWLSVQSSGGTAPPRFNHSAAIYDSKLIVFGGINIDGFLPPSINILELDTVISQKMHDRENPGGIRSSSLYNNSSGLQHSVSIAQNAKQNRSSIADKNIRFDSIPFSEHMKEIQAENFDESKLLVNQLSFGNFKSFLPVPRYTRQPTKKNTAFMKQPVLYNSLTNQAITPTSSPRPPLQYE